MMLKRRALDGTIGSLMITASVWLGLEFIYGVGYGGNGTVLQVLIAGGLGATASFGVISLRSAVKGAGDIPGMITGRMRRRPFAHNLITGIPGILSRTTPVIRHPDINPAFISTFTEIIEHEGRTITIEHDHHDGRTSAQVAIQGPGGENISDSLKGQEARLFSKVLDRCRIESFSKMLRCAPTREAIAVNVGLRIPHRGSHQDVIFLEDGTEGLRFVSLVKKTDYGTWRTAWIMHPDIGYLLLPRDVVTAAQQEKRDHLLHEAFDSRIEALPDLPTIIGDPVTAKKISLARKLVDRYPDMKDAAGTPITPLVQDHLPRLLHAHAEAIRSATASDMINEDMLRAIADKFEEGMTVLTRAVLEGVEAEQRKSQDDLSVEIEFLKMRHPPTDVLSAA